MPEGDSLVRVAQRLRPALLGATLRSLVVPERTGPPPRTGSRIEIVEAQGKYLRIAFEGRIELLTHLRMNGRWMLGPRDEPPQAARGAVRVRLETDDHVALCVRAPVVRLLRVGDGASKALDHLGPDLCRLDADLDLAVQRLESQGDPDGEIADALMNQRAMAGVGNVYKSEVLFACRINPFRSLASISEEDRRRLVATAARQLRANLGPGRRQTVPGGLAVYGRDRQACLRCGTLILTRSQGPLARPTYWCPTCQPPPR